MENSSVATLDAISNTSYIDPVRGDIAREATYEIDALCELLLQQAEGVRYIHEHHGMTIGLQMRGIARRMRELNSVILSSIDDSMATNDELKSTVG